MMYNKNKLLTSYSISDINSKMAPKRSKNQLRREKLKQRKLEKQAEEPDKSVNVEEPKTGQIAQQSVYKLTMIHCMNNFNQY